ncbi:MAG: 16S rRNA (cytosine(1402)-N(4))-methyltransferase RsmH [Dongiaceae bacterium]
MSAPEARPAGGHAPVLLREVLQVLNPRDGGIYVDGTFGVGGYSRAILEAADCTVWAIDRDPDAIARARAMPDYGSRLHAIEGRFGDMETLLAAHGIDQADGIALDLGVSSPQFDEAERGFSFRQDGPLDMRMGKAGRSAADIVNDEDETALATIFRDYGEERRARAIARAIVAVRGDAPIRRTAALADIVRSVFSARERGTARIDPATRSFQALRIAVNDELGELDRALVGAERLLNEGGRLAVVSFHSLEDRRVKRFLAERSGRNQGGSRHLPVAKAGPAPTFRRIAGEEATAGEVELAANPRSRSARLRAAERTAAQAWQNGGRA